MMSRTQTDAAARRPGARVSARRALGGARGNAQLTSLTGLVLLVLLAVEGATVPAIRQLLSVHIFVGMLLLGPVTLKLASTGYRFARYYGGAREYVAVGPPEPLMRFVVAPVLVFSTMALFASGVALLVVPQRGLVLELHKASFVVWFGAMSVHVLGYTIRALRNVVGSHARVPSGAAARLALATVAIGAGLALAAATYPLAQPWFHQFAR